MIKKELDLKQIALDRLEERGVTLADIAELVLFLQEPYFEALHFDVCLENVQSVMGKREIQHAIITGIELDMLAEKKCFRNRYKTYWPMMKGCMALMKSWL